MTTTTSGPSVVIPESRTVAQDTQTFTFINDLHVCDVPWRDKDGYFNDPSQLSWLLNQTIRFSRWIERRGP